MAAAVTAAAAGMQPCIRAVLLAAPPPRGLRQAVGGAVELEASLRRPVSEWQAD